MRSLVLVLCFLTLPVVANAQTVTVARNAPIYLKPEVTPTPLRVAAAGTRLRVIADRGSWVQVEFNDPQFGPRIGWIERQNLVDERLQPQDLSVSEDSAARPSPRPRQPSAPGPQFAAEYPSFETAIGWSFLRASDSGITINAPLGWNVSVAGNLTPFLGIVADATGHYKDDLFDIDGTSAMVHAIMGGPRASLRLSPVAVPFGQFLVGYARSDADVFGVDVSSNDVAIQPGGGVDIGGRNVAARFEVGWRKIFYEEASDVEFRVVVGVVIRAF